MGQEARLSPNPANHDIGPSSPHPSYYSASEIPPSSPLPSPKYKYPSGEITSTPPSRRASIATTRTSVRGGLQEHFPMPSPPDPLYPPSSPNTLQLPGHYRPGIASGSSSNPDVFEMRVRSPSNDYVSSHGHSHSPSERAPSATSYMTAVDDLWAEDDPGSNHQRSTLERRSPGYDHDTSSQQHRGSTSDDDRSTVIGHGNQRHDRDSSLPWDSPRAV